MKDNIEEVKDPLYLADILGRAMGEIPEHFVTFCISFTESLLESYRIPDRIDWLFLNPDAIPLDPKVAADRMEWGEQKGAIYIKDLKDNLNLALLRGTEGDIASYAIRWFDNDKPMVKNDPMASFPQVVGESYICDDREFCHYLVEIPDVFWNFRRSQDGIKTLYHSEACLHPDLTVSAVMSITWATNLLGFAGRKKALKRA